MSFVNKLKILFVIPTLEMGGAERLIINICNELNKRNNVEFLLVVLYPINNYNSISSQLNIHYCKSRVEHSILKKSKVYIDDFEKLILDFKPDIIHSNLLETEFLSHWICFKNTKYISHCHNNIPLYKNFSIKTLFSKQKIILFAKKISLLKKYKETNNHFIAISKDSYKYLTKNLPAFFEGNIHLLHNAIDFNLFNRETNKKLPNDKIKLITVGHLNKNKNQTFLIHVMHFLIKNNINCELQIFGDGPIKGEIEILINNYKLNNNVFLRGKVENIEEHLWQSHLYVHSALSEAFGLVLIEAMASGLPVICLDGKGNRDIVKDSENGFIIYKNNPKAFANMIISIIENKEFYESMSKNAIETAKKYDIKNYVGNLINLYEKVKKS